MSSKKIVLITALILIIAAFPAISQECSPVDATISADFTYDGVGDFCWESTCLGDYINCWNLELMTINGVNFTNLYVAANQYPAPVNGRYYIRYVGNYDWSHIELRGSCGTGPTAPPVTPAPTGAPTDPLVTPGPGIGDVSMSPSSIVVQSGDSFSFGIVVNSGGQRVAAYGIDITYDASVLTANAAVAGADGFVSAVNLNDPGIIVTSGFDASGVGPGGSLELLVIQMTADNQGTSAIGINVDKLVDEATNTVGNPNGIGGTVTVIGGGEGGDVSMSPSSISANVGDPVSFSIMVDSGNQKLAAFGLEITYNASVLSADSVVAGADGFVAATRLDDPGIIVTSGFDTAGVGPGAALELLVVNMTAIGSGTSQVGITVKKLVDE